MDAERNTGAPHRVRLGQTVETEFAAFRFGLGAAVMHKTRPRLKWAVEFQALIRTPGGVERVYMLSTVTDGMDGEGPIQPVRIQYYEHEIAPYVEEEEEESCSND